MTDDDNRRAERRRRMDEILAEAETNVKRPRPLRDERVDESRGTVWGSALGVVILLLLAVVFYMGSRTVNRFTSADFDDADRRGVATVKSCERRGPITLKGFGYYDRCTVDLVWSDGEGPTIVLDKPGFMRGEKPGDTFEIGRNAGTRGSVEIGRAAGRERGEI